MRDERLQPAEPLRTRDNAGEHEAHHAGGLQQAISGDGGSAVRPGDAWLGGVVPASGIAHEASGALPGGRGRASGSGHPDGGAFGTASSAERFEGPRFDRLVPRGGYGWWYIDALSEDKQHGLTIIAFVGSVFSPYYAWSGWRDPENHCAMNVALYSVKGNRWCMTERGRSSLTRDQNSIAINRSSMRWDSDGLTIDIDEWTAPLPSRVRGTVRLRAEGVASQIFPLDADGRHSWRPIVPRGRVEVNFDGGATAWKGEAYLDSNWGDQPLEHRFREWDWSRAHVGDGDTVVYYDVTPRGDDERRLALRFDRSGWATEVEGPPRAALPSTFWRMRPTTRGIPGKPPRRVRTLEDSPFYARSHLVGEIDGAPADMMHESLSLNRFSNPVVRAMLPFRMPRLARRR
jgi:carotenoid 1,2-hydratase